jgi:hypothetical protein
LEDAWRDEYGVMVEDQEIGDRGECPRPEKKSRSLKKHPVIE